VPHIQPGVVPRVDIAAGIAQPDIVAGIRVVKRQRILRSIEQEAIGAAEQSVHDEHHRSGGFPGIVQPRGVWDAEQIQHIAVRGLRKMRFGRIAMLLNALRLQ